MLAFSRKSMRTKEGRQCSEAASTKAKGAMDVQLTGIKTARPMPERAVALLDARLAPTHAQVSSRDANVRKGFARATNAGKYVLQANPARPSAHLS